MVIFLCYTLYIEVVLTSNVSINWVKLVIFVMPTQDKYSSRLRNVGQINSLVYKLTKTQQPRIHQLINSELKT